MNYKQTHNAFGLNPGTRFFYIVRDEKRHCGRSIGTAEIVSVSFSPKLHVPTFVVRGIDMAFYGMTEWKVRRSDLHRVFLSKTEAAEQLVAECCGSLFRIDKQSIAKMEDAIRIYRETEKEGIV